MNTLANLSVGFLSRLSKKARTAVVLAAAVTGMGGSAAFADRPGPGDRYDRNDRNDRYDRDGRRDRDDWRDRRDNERRNDESDFAFRLRIGGRPEIRRERVWIEPEYRTICERVWVEPVYRDVCDRVWVEPVYRTECEKIWVPDRFEWREVRGRYGRCERVQVLVEPAHYETRERQVVVVPGHFEERRSRVVVTDGCWKTVERRECVREGRWDYRVAETYGHRDSADLAIRIGGH